MSEVQAKVLIVEDTIDLAEIIIAVVERISMKPLHATHGAKAIATIQEENPDLVLLDLGLPDMRGWRILDAVKDENGQFSTPVVVITAHGDAANRLMGKLRNVAAYMIKPCTPEEVEEIISEVLLEHGIIEAKTSDTPGATK